MRHEKAGQLLDLARRLSATAEGLTLDEIAAACGVGRRTAERLRDAVEALFPQMEVVAEGTTKRFRIPGGLDGLYQAPTTEELVELGNAAASLRLQGQIARAEALETLERKVRSATKTATLRKLSPDIDALTRAELSAIRAGPRPYEDPQAFAVIRRAIMSLCGLRIRYRGGSRPGQWREITPYGLLFERMNYLVGAELGSEQPRNWRLDRIEDIELLETHTYPPESFDMAAYANRSFGIYQDEVEEVRLRILPASAAEARGWRFHASQVLTEASDGSVIVAFTSSGMLELAWHLFTWGDQVEILAPENLKQKMVGALHTALSVHDANPNTTNNDVNTP